MQRRELLQAGLLLSAGAGGALAVTRSRPAPVADRWGTLRKASYAEQGEDLILAKVLDRLRAPKPTFIDIGAFHPVRDSNTFLLYERGMRGVVVEPNPTMAALLREVRPKDVTLEVGMAADDADSADYYVIGDEPALNTFSKERAEGCGHRITAVIKRRLVGVNQILAAHFPVRPTVLSIDIEGLDVEVLRGLDFGRFGPDVLCVETDHLLYDATEHAPLFELLRDRGYALHAGTFINTIFLREACLRETLGRKG